MKRRTHGFVSIVALMFALLFFISCNGTDVTEPTKTPVVSGPPANTTYPMPPVKTSSINNMGWTFPDGKRSLFSEYKGKVLILDFYATWCEPCRRSVPHLVGLQKKYAEEGFTVVGLNVGGEEDHPKIAKFAKELGINYPLAIPDDELALFLLGDDDGIPQTFIFDRQGVLVDRLIGFGASSGAEIDEHVEAALKTAP